MLCLMYTHFSEFIILYCVLLISYITSIINCSIPAFITSAAETIGKVYYKLSLFLLLGILHQLVFAPKPLTSIVSFATALPCLLSERAIKGTAPDNNSGTQHVQTVGRNFVVSKTQMEDVSPQRF